MLPKYTSTPKYFKIQPVLFIYTNSLSSIFIISDLQENTFEAIRSNHPLQMSISIYQKNFQIQKKDFENLSYFKKGILGFI